MVTIIMGSETVYQCLDKEDAPVPFKATARRGWLELVIFGKPVRVRCGSYGEARTAANEWNTHFEKGWDGVRGVTAAVMESYIKRLRGLGIDEETLSKAIGLELADGE